MSDTTFTSDAITITAADGQQLTGTLFQPAQANGLSLQINGATGVPRGYYAAFAAYQAARGFTVLTFDYRGIGDSSRSAGAPPPRMLDWAVKDVPAAAAFLAQRAPGQKRTYLGHSFGGQILGLLPQAGEIAAAITIGAQQGYWRNWPVSHQLYLPFWWYVLVPGLVALTGKLPGTILGSEDLPRGVALDWARWCKTPQYLVDDAGRPMRPYNDRIAAALRMISFADDDKFGPRRGVDALAGYYPRARIERLHVAPADWGLRRIGHFGFFKRAMPQERWAEQGDWLAAAAAGAAQRAA
jgi:predicted alpha/beta hydrolase